MNHQAKHKLRRQKGYSRSPFHVPPWILDFIIEPPSVPTSGKLLSLIKCVSGPEEDGSYVKLGSDTDVSINVRFSAAAIENLNAECDSDSQDQSEWSRSLIILKEYKLEHRHTLKKNECFFELCVDSFKVWANREGCHSKLIPKFCMDIPEVQRKSDQMWFEWRKNQRLSRTASKSVASASASASTSASQNESVPSSSSQSVDRTRDNQSMRSSISLTQLLEQMNQVTPEKKVVEDADGANTDPEEKEEASAQAAPQGKADGPDSVRRKMQYPKVVLNRLELKDLPGYARLSTLTDSFQALTLPPAAKALLEQSHNLRTPPVDECQPVNPSPLPQAPLEANGEENNTESSDPAPELQPPPVQSHSSQENTSITREDVSAQVGPSLLAAHGESQLHDDKDAPISKSVQIGDSLLMMDSQPTSGLGKETHKVRRKSSRSNQSRTRSPEKSQDEDSDHPQSDHPQSSNSSREGRKTRRSQSSTGSDSLPLTLGQRVPSTSDNTSSGSSGIALHQVTSSGDGAIDAASKSDHPANTAPTASSTTPTPPVSRKTRTPTSKTRSNRTPTTATATKVSPEITPYKTEKVKQAGGTRRKSYFRWPQEDIIQSRGNVHAVRAMIHGESVAGTSESNKADNDDDNNDNTQETSRLGKDVGDYLEAVELSCSTAGETSASDQSHNTPSSFTGRRKSKSKTRGAKARTAAEAKAESVPSEEEPKRELSSSLITADAGDFAVLKLPLVKPASVVLCRNEAVVDQSSSSSSSHGKSSSSLTLLSQHSPLPLTSSTPRDKGSAPRDKGSAPRDKNSTPRDKVSTPRDKSSTPHDKDSETNSSLKDSEDIVHPTPPSRQRRSLAPKMFSLRSHGNNSDDSISNTSSINTPVFRMNRLPVNDSIIDSKKDSAQRRSPRTPKPTYKVKEKTPSPPSVSKSTDIVFPTPPRPRRSTAVGGEWSAPLSTVRYHSTQISASQPPPGLALSLSPVSSSPITPSRDKHTEVKDSPAAKTPVPQQETKKASSDDSMKGKPVDVKSPEQPSSSSSSITPDGGDTSEGKLESSHSKQTDSDIPTGSSQVEPITSPNSSQKEVEESTPVSSHSIPFSSHVKTRRSGLNPPSVAEQSGTSELVAPSPASERTTSLHRRSISSGGKLRGSARKLKQADEDSSSSPSVRNNAGSKKVSDIASPLSSMRKSKRLASPAVDPDLRPFKSVATTSSADKEKTVSKISDVDSEDISSSNNKDQGSDASSPPSSPIFRRSTRRPPSKLETSGSIEESLSSPSAIPLTLLSPPTPARLVPPAASEKSIKEKSKDKDENSSAVNSPASKTDGPVRPQLKIDRSNTPRTRSAASPSTTTPSNTPEVLPTGRTTRNTHMGRKGKTAESVRTKSILSKVVATSKRRATLSPVRTRTHTNSETSTDYSEKPEAASINSASSTDDSEETMATSTNSETSTDDSEKTVAASTISETSTGDSEKTMATSTNSASSTDDSEKTEAVSTNSESSTDDSENPEAAATSHKEKETADSTRLSRSPDDKKKMSDSDSDVVIPFGDINDGTRHEFKRNTSATTTEEKEYLSELLQFKPKAIKKERDYILRSGPGTYNYEEGATEIPPVEDRPTTANTTPPPEKPPTQPEYRGYKNVKVVLTDISSILLDIRRKAQSREKSVAETVSNSEESEVEETEHDLDRARDISLSSFLSPKVSLNRVNANRIEHSTVQSMQSQFVNLFESESNAESHKSSAKDGASSDTDVLESPPLPRRETRTRKAVKPPAASYIEINSSLEEEPKEGKGDDSFQPSDLDGMNSTEGEDNSDSAYEPPARPKRSKKLMSVIHKGAKRQTRRPLKLKKLAKPVSPPHPPPSPPETEELLDEDDAKNTSQTSPQSEPRKAKSSRKSQKEEIIPKGVSPKKFNVKPARKKLKKKSRLNDVAEIEEIREEGNSLEVSSIEISVQQKEDAKSQSTESEENNVETDALQSVETDALQSDPVDEMSLSDNSPVRRKRAKKRTVRKNVIISDDDQLASPEAAASSAEDPDFAPPVPKKRKGRKGKETEPSSDTTTSSAPPKRGRKAKKEQQIVLDVKERKMGLFKDTGQGPDINALFVATTKKKPIGRKRRLYTDKMSMLGDNPADVPMEIEESPSLTKRKRRFFSGEANLSPMKIDGDPSTPVSKNEESPAQKLVSTYGSIVKSRRKLVTSPDASPISKARKISSNGSNDQDMSDKGSSIDTQSLVPSSGVDAQPPAASKNSSVANEQNQAAAVPEASTEDVPSYTEATAENGAEEIPNDINTNAGDVPSDTVDSAVLPSEENQDKLVSEDKVEESEVSSNKDTLTGDRQKVSDDKVEEDNIEESEVTSNKDALEEDSREVSENNIEESAITSDNDALKEDTHEVSENNMEESAITSDNDALKEDTHEVSQDNIEDPEVTSDNDALEEDTHKVPENNIEDPEVSCDKDTLREDTVSEDKVEESEVTSDNDALTEDTQEVPENNMEESEVTSNNDALEEDTHEVSEDNMEESEVTSDNDALKEDTHKEGSTPKYVCAPPSTSPDNTKEMQETEKTPSESVNSGEESHVDKTLNNEAPCKDLGDKEIDTSSLFGETHVVPSEDESVVIPQPALVDNSDERVSVDNSVVDANHIELETGVGKESLEHVQPQPAEAATEITEEVVAEKTIVTTGSSEKETVEKTVDVSDTTDERLVAAALGTTDSMDTEVVQEHLETTIKTHTEAVDEDLEPNTQNTYLELVQKPIDIITESTNKIVKQPVDTCTITDQSTVVESFGMVDVTDREIIQESIESREATSEEVFQKTVHKEDRVPAITQGPENDKQEPSLQAVPDVELPDQGVADEEEVADESFQTAMNDSVRESDLSSSADVSADILPGDAQNESVTDKDSETFVDQSPEAVLREEEQLEMPPTSQDLHLVLTPTQNTIASSSSTNSTLPSSSTSSSYTPSTVPSSSNSSSFTQNTLPGSLSPKSSIPGISSSQTSSPASPDTGESGATPAETQEADDERENRPEIINTEQDVHSPLTSEAVDDAADGRRLMMMVEPLRESQISSSGLALLSWPRDLTHRVVSYFGSKKFAPN